MKKVILFMALVFFLSCNLKKENHETITSENLDINRSLTMRVLDSIDGRPTMEILDSIQRSLDKDIVFFKEEILNFVKKERFLLKDTSILAKALSGNTNSYYEISLHMGPQIENYSNFYKYSYYMTQKYGYKEAYSDVFIYSDASSNINYKYKNVHDNIWALDCVEEDLKKLALSCLISSYKNDPWAAKVLAYYFRTGYYFPKNMKAANELDSIYNEAYPPFDGE